jgi:hypothetical protein
MSAFSMPDRAHWGPDLPKEPLGKSTGRFYPLVVWINTGLGFGEERPYAANQKSQFLRSLPAAPFEKSGSPESLGGILVAPS